MKRPPYRPRDPVATAHLMASVRRRDTGAEMALRRALWKRGARYRVHQAGLQGTPDIVFPSAHLVVFVDGDYWHGRLLLQHGARALRRSFRTSNWKFWTTKIRKNVERDRRQTLALRALGWRVLRLWERDILQSADEAADRVLEVRDSKSWAEGRDLLSTS
jgi:DNA mismatch endonuclease, patch repair protein